MLGGTLWQSSMRGRPSVRRTEQLEIRTTVSSRTAEVCISRHYRHACVGEVSPCAAAAMRSFISSALRAAISLPCSALRNKITLMRCAPSPAAHRTVPLWGCRLGHGTLGCTVQPAYPMSRMPSSALRTAAIATCAARAMRQSARPARESPNCLCVHLVVHMVR